MPDAIIYIRFSTAQQEEGDSRRRQRDDCARFCKEKGLNVVEWVEDLGRSAWRGDHLTYGNLGKLTERIRRREIPDGTVLVVEKLDRLSREKPRTIRRWIEDVTDQGIRIAQIAPERWIDAEYLDDGRNMGAMIETAYEYNAAHQYSENISYRVGKRWTEKRELAAAGHGILTATSPGWLQAVGEWGGKNTPDNRHFELIPERAAIVVKVYQLAADGMGSWGIANYLNERNVEPWGKRAATSTRSRWNHTSVLNILNSPAVEGIHYPMTSEGKKRVRTGQVLHCYPRIEELNADLIARARAQLSKRKSGATRSNTGRNLLASLARCGECAGYMILRTRGHKEGPFAYLQCDNAYKHKCSSRGMFNYRHLEPAILDAVLHLSLDDSFFSVADKSAELRIALAELDKKLRDTKEERDNTRALLRRMPDDDQLMGDWQALTTQVKELEGERTVLAAAFAQANGEISDAEHLKRVHNYRVALNDEDEEVRRTARLRVRDALRTVVGSVTCQQGDNPDGSGKRLNVELANGLIGFSFDNTGALKQQWDFRNSPDHIHGLTAGEMAENKERVDAVLRRS